MAGRGQGTVYFVKPVGLEGPIKIGITGNLQRRLAAMYSQSPLRLELIVAVQGADPAIERNLHECFMDSHSHSEWFHPSPRLLRSIELLRAGVSLAQAVDLSKRHGNFKTTQRGVSKTPEAKTRIGWVQRMAWASRRCAGTPPADVIALLDAMRHRLPTAAELERLHTVVSDPVSHFIRRASQGSSPASADDPLIPAGFARVIGSPQTVTEGHP